MSNAVCLYGLLLYLSVNKPARCAKSQSSFAKTNRRRESTQCFND